MIFFGGFVAGVIAGVMVLLMIEAYLTMRGGR